MDDLAQGLPRGVWPQFAATVALALFTAGCGNAPSGKVNGQVTLEGKPVGPGSIIFIPANNDNRPLPSARGTFGDDGRYELTTRVAGDGAVVGMHKVIIQATAGGNFGEETAGLKEGRIPLRYADPNQSGLVAEVKLGQNTLDFALDRLPGDSAPTAPGSVR